MNAQQPPQVPPVEQPTSTSDDVLEKLEESTLDKQARSAAYRAAVEHSQHIAALNKRLDIIQAKLDGRENEIHIALPRIAELEQAEKTSKLTTVVESVGAGGGAVLLSLASFAPTDAWKFSFLGSGVAASALAVFCKSMFALFGWPKRPARQ